MSEQSNGLLAFFIPLGIVVNSALKVVKVFNNLNHIILTTQNKKIAAPLALLFLTLHCTSEQNRTAIKSLGNFYSIR